MFVVKTLTEEPMYKAFGNMGAAQRWAEADAYLKHSAEQCQIYRTVGGLTQRQAVAAVRLGKAERLQTVFRKLEPGAARDPFTAISSRSAQGEPNDA